MLKLVGKIVYITFAVVLTVLVFTMARNSAYYSYVQEKFDGVNNVELAQYMAGSNYYVDTTPIYTNEDDADAKTHMSIFCSMQRVALDLYENNTKKEHFEYDKVEFMYFVIFYDNKFESSVNEIGGIKRNDTGLKFTCADSSEAKFDFVMTDEINTPEDFTKLSKYPSTAGEEYAYRDRNILKSFKDYKFMIVELTESYLNYISTSSVTGLTLIDSNNDPVITANVNLDFGQQFFTDFTELKTNINTFKAGNKEENPGYQAAKEFVDEFEVESLGVDHYVEGRDIVAPMSKLVWSGIGVSLLFILAASIVYVLVFHFQAIKKKIFRKSQTNYRYAPKAGAQQRQSSDVINAKVTPVKEVETEKTEDK